jgi:hypothetical protein
VPLVGLVLQFILEQIRRLLKVKDAAGLVYEGSGPHARDWPRPVGMEALRVEEEIEGQVGLSIIQQLYQFC